MKIAVLYDNTPWTEGFQFGWGFSCLVDQRILFDTGENGKSLLENINRLKVDISKIEAVVISHDHWDHTGGLWELLKRQKGIKVYACPGFSTEFKKMVRVLEGQLIENNTFHAMDSSISVTGEIPGQYKGDFMPEQALLVKRENGITILTGCSHPGIIPMIHKVKSIFPQEPMALVMGGFHLMDQDPSIIESIVTSMKALGVLQVGPTHCTGNQAKKIFQTHYGKHFISVGAGFEFDI